MRMEFHLKATRLKLRKLIRLHLGYGGDRMLFPRKSERAELELLGTSESPLYSTEMSGDRAGTHFFVFHFIILGQLPAL